MSTNTDDNIPSDGSPEPKDEPMEMETIHFAQHPVHVTAEVDLMIDKPEDIKTIDSPDNDITEDEQLNTKRSRELKMLLALSKEANLETNISYKRKSMDTIKVKEMASMSPKVIPENDQVVKKVRSLEKIDKFPITAESELESAVGESTDTLEVIVSEKTKKEGPKSKDVTVVEEKKIVKDVKSVGEQRKNIKDIKMFKPDKDVFCWRCHREGVNISCETCPRAYHQKCLKQTISDVNNWPCPECVAILKAESTQTRSPALKGMTLEHLCGLLKFAVKRMIECNGSEPFLHAVNENDFPEYKKFIIQPMNLTLLEKNIKENLYGSPQAFEADAKWILHNSIIFNSYQSKLTSFAKTIIKICKQEMAEIENCPSCYLNANTKKSTWFVEVCPKPHILVWAKLKGFPYWPAKAMCTNSSGMVDVRFFGAHDRAWVPSKECFLYSRRDPNSNKQKRNDIIECMREVEVYISNLKALYGEFNYAPFKLPYDPDNELKQLHLFIPRYKPNAPPPRKRNPLSESKAKFPMKKEDGDNEKDEAVPEVPKDESKELMEGYGTDDDTAEGESLNETKRAKMLRKKSDETENEDEYKDEGSEHSDSSDDEEEGEEEEMDQVEAELDDDTQVSATVPADKNPGRNFRTRRGLTCSPGTVKTIPRRTSEENTSRKRLSVDEIATPNKLSRRNSDQSVKSDSSRLSTISDKINRVDISENFELTLGNTPDKYISSNSNDTESKKKPVQIDVDNSELSISPQSKIKITDRLMKKLSSSDEDMSKSSSDKEQPDAKSQTDILLEKYRKLVKEKSREFLSSAPSTSFTNACISSEDICESSSDLEKTKIDAEKTETEVEKSKNDAEKTETDIETTKKDVENNKPEEKKETEKNNEVMTETPDKNEGKKIGEKMKTRSSETAITSTGNSKKFSENIENKELDEPGTKLKLKRVDGRIEVIKTYKRATPTKDAAAKKANLILAAVTTPKKDNANIDANRKETKDQLEDTVSSKENADANPAKSNDATMLETKEDSQLKNESEIEISTRSGKKVVTNEICVREVITESRGKKDNKKPNDNNSSEKLQQPLNNVETEATPTEQVKTKKMPPPQAEVKTNESIKEKETENTECTEKIAETDQMVMETKCTVPDLIKEDIKIISNDVEFEDMGTEKKGEVADESISKKSDEAMDSNSSDDQDVVLDDTQIDEANIMNIIHSSLNGSDRLKRSLDETADEETPQKTDKKKAKKEETKRSNQTKKIQVNSDRNESVPLDLPNFKIVPIQSILDKTIENTTPERSVLTSNPILLKKLSQVEEHKNVVDVSAQEQLVCVEIKSEPESSDEGLLESEYMEKKRKYLSALNISERTEENSAPKKNEIRTRSKTEEIGKGRHLDNMSKIIDEVATTFSAKHDTIRRVGDKKATNQSASNPQTREERRKSIPQDNGEIYVKSFAKIPNQQPQQIRPALQRLPSAAKPKPNAFPVKTVSVQQGTPRREVPQKPTPELIPTATLTRIPPSASPAMAAPVSAPPTATQVPPLAPPSANKTVDQLNSSSLSSSGNVLILTQPGVILPTSQQLTYNAGSFVTFVPSQQNMTMMQSSQVINAVMATGFNQQAENIQPARTPNVEVHRSQNYIPQNEEESNAKKRCAINPPTSAVSNNTNNTVQINQAPTTYNDASNVAPVNEGAGTSAATPTGTVAIHRTEDGEDEFSLLHSLVPESVSRTISEVLCRPPPKLKPRPPGPLSQVFESGNPSSAGPVSAKINSISHRLGDYFRGMLIEMLEDLGKSNNAEATISSLKHENETLQHKHASEMMDIRKNVCTILKDIQGSIAEERERIIDETRSACEIEALRRIEEAKSKQWCANCGKEAQFYCCWNTSYCDYPCQQKHWCKHMNKCTQHAGQPQPQPVPTPAIRPPQNQITFRPSTPKTFTGRIVAKPTKVYLNRSANPMSVSTFKSTTGGHLALVDPSNLEFLTSSSMGAKFIATSSLFTKVKNVNSTVTSPSNGTQQPVVLNQKMNNSIQIVKPLPLPSTSNNNNVSNVISDDEFESE